MAIFTTGSTVVCSLEVYKDGALYDPATSTSIKITRRKPMYALIVDTTAMTPDSTGKFHYDLDTSGITLDGKFRATYTCVDGARTSISRDMFDLE